MRQEGPAPGKMELRAKNRQSPRSQGPRATDGTILTPGGCRVDTEVPHSLRPLFLLCPAAVGCRGSGGLALCQNLLL